MRNRSAPKPRKPRNDGKYTHRLSSFFLCLLRRCCAMGWGRRLTRSVHWSWSGEPTRPSAREPFFVSQGRHAHGFLGCPPFAVRGCRAQRTRRCDSVSRHGAPPHGPVGMRRSWGQRDRSRPSISVQDNATIAGSIPKRAAKGAWSAAIAWRTRDCVAGSTGLTVMPFAIIRSRADA